MLPVDFIGSNLTLTKPLGWTDEQCESLRTYHGDINGALGFKVAYAPNVDDIHAIINKTPVFVKLQISDDTGRFIRVTSIPGRVHGFMWCKNLTAWLPSRREIDILVKYNRLFIFIVGNTFPPISVWTQNKEGIING